MRSLLAMWLSLMLGFLPQHLTLAAQPSSGGCCGCKCGAQPTPRPVQQNAPAAAEQSQSEQSEIRGSTESSCSHFFSATRDEGSRVVVFLPPGVPLYTWQCALLI